MNYGEIKIITATLNQSQCTQKTIEGVLNQERPNLEYNVGDGFSTDSKLDIRKRDSNRLIWNFEKDSGLVNAFFDRMRRFIGEFISFINSDRYYLSCVFYQVDIIESFNLDENWLIGSNKVINSIIRPIHPLIDDYDKFLRNYASINTINQASYIFRPITF